MPIVREVLGRVQIIDNQIFRWTIRQAVRLAISITDRQTDGQTTGQADRQTNIQTDKQTDRQIDNLHTEREYKIYKWMQYQIERQKSLNLT